MRQALISTSYQVQQLTAATLQFVGVPDKVLGERIVGFVRLDVSQTLETMEQEIIAWLATQLANHKLPEILLLVERIPRTAFGRVDRRSLRALADTELAGRCQPRT